MPLVLQRSAAAAALLATLSALLCTGSNASLLRHAAFVAEQGTVQEHLSSKAASAGDDTARRTLQALDSNHDGRVEPKEVTAFATAHKLDATSIAEEFSSIDLNGDGTLDAQEIDTALGSKSASKQQGKADSQAAVAQTAPAANASPAAQTPAAVQTQAVQPSPAAQALADQQALLANETPVSAHLPVPAAVQPPMSAQPAVVDPAAIVASAQSLNLGGLSKADLKPIEAMSIADHSSEAQDAVSGLSAQLAIEERAEAKAAALEKQVTQLRANASALATAAAERTASLGVAASQAAAVASLAEITQMESQARRAEITAAALHSKAAAELLQADGLMAAAEAALRGPAARTSA